MSGSVTVTCSAGEAKAQEKPDRQMVMESHQGLLTKINTIHPPMSPLADGILGNGAVGGSWKGCQAEEKVLTELWGGGGGGNNKTH